MKKIPLYLLLCIVSFSTGCPKYKPEIDFNNTKRLTNKLNAYFMAKQNAYIAALGAAPDGPARAKTIRNEVLESALPFIDDAYMDFITDLQAGRDRANFVLDLIDLGTSAAVGITNGERPLQILGVALTAFRGGRRSADLNFYKEQTTPVLISKMDGNRAKVRATILTREKEGVDTYPIGAAIGDIVEYYNAGTLVRAFTELSKDTAVQTQQSEKRVLELKNINPADVVTLTPDVRKTAPQIGRKNRNLFKTLDKGTAEQIQEATENLRLAYLDVAKGEKSDQFKPILDKIKQEKQTLKTDMEKLESSDEATRNSVDGKRILDIMQEIFTSIDLQTQGDLIVALSEIYNERF